jgi:hypothetical protein
MSFDSEWVADMKPVSLQAVVDAMEFVGDETTAYINNKTGELFTVADDEARLIEDGYRDDDFIPDWQREILPKVREVLESGDFVPLPDKFEIHEYSIMERFCRSIENVDLQQELLHAIRGGGAFRRFKNIVHRRAVQDDWYGYRNNALKRIAADCLEEEGIAFSDSQTSTP